MADVLFLGLSIIGGVLFIADTLCMLVTFGEEGLLLYLIKEGIVHFIEICKGSGYLRIPFKTFEHLYYINPEKWDIDNKDYVKYLKGSGHRPNYERFEFALLDYFKYQNFRKTIDKKSEKKLHLAREKARQKRLEECTKLWIKDIEAFSAENKKRLETAKAENEEIIKRILGEEA